MAKKEKNKYSQNELIKFEKLIHKKIDVAQNELDFIKESLLRKHISGTDTTQGALKTLFRTTDSPPNTKTVIATATKNKSVSPSYTRSTRIVPSVALMLTFSCLPK